MANNQETDEINQGIDISEQDPIIEIKDLVQPGTLLRKKREELGLSQRDVSDQLRLRISIIKSIDNNELDLGQVPTFIRGYLRSYAKLILIDEHIILDAFDAINASSQTLEDHYVELQSFSRKTAKARHENNIMKITWVIIVILFAITLTWIFQDQDSPIDDLYSSQAVISELTLDVEKEIQILESDVEINNDERSRSGANNLATNKMKNDVKLQKKSDVNMRKKERIEAISESESTSTLEISMKFDDNCWLEIIDKNGSVILNGLKEKGDEIDMKLVGIAPFDILLGAPEEVDKLVVNGRKIDISDYPKNQVARLTFPQ